MTTTELSNLLSNRTFPADGSDYRAIFSAGGSALVLYLLPDGAIEFTKQ